MSEADHHGIPVLAADHPLDPDQAISSLRQRGADRLDPVCFHYMESLTRRIPAQQGAVRRILERRLAEALTAYEARFELARKEANDAIKEMVEHRPEAMEDLLRLFNAGDFREVRRVVAGLKEGKHHGSLADLVRHLEQSVAVKTDCDLEGRIGSRADLKTIRYFRTTWAKLSVDRTLNHAFEQGPENAGPLNSHMLVLRSLSLMRHLSPDYLSRFMSYVDTLLWLDQAGKTSKPPEQNIPRRRRQKGGTAPTA